MHTGPFRSLILVVVLLGSGSGVGCVSSILANRIVRAPNLQKNSSVLKHFAENQPAIENSIYSRTTIVHVTPDPATLSIGIIEPGDYGLVYELKPSNKGAANGQQFWNLHFEASPRAKASPANAKATIFLLHGVMMSKETMLHWGYFLAQEGYRLILVDLRGHGQSTGKFITYGARETGDLSQVLDELFRRNLVTGQVGVLGMSYGGAIGIAWAAREPRITSVVALAAFSDARVAIDEFMRATMPRLMTYVSPENMQAGLALAARRGGFTWEQVDVLAAAGQLRQPVLLVHGSNDDWVKPAHSQRLKAAAPAGSRLLMGPGNHLTLSLRLHPLSHQIKDWFDRDLTAGLPF